eukprot:3260911-Pyramimonas_sp.AAC.2
MASRPGTNVVKLVGVRLARALNPRSGVGPAAAKQFGRPPIPRGAERPEGAPAPEYCPGERLAPRPHEQ